MKLSNPLAIKFTSLAASFVVRGWMHGVPLRFKLDDPATHPYRANRPILYVTWHEGLLVPAYGFSHRRVGALASQHRDGELITQIVRMLRGFVMRGSSTRGGVLAMRALLRRGKLSHIALMPDGPRGPRRIMKDGAIYLASRVGMPIVPVGIGFRRCWRVKSWDRMVIPFPGEPVLMLGSPPIEVPRRADREELERYRVQVEQALNDVQARAERDVMLPMDTDGFIEP